MPDGTLKGQQGGIVALEPFTAERAQGREDRRSERAGRNPDEGQRSAGAIPLQRRRSIRQDGRPEQPGVQRQAADRRHLRHLVSQLPRRSAGAGEALPQVSRAGAGDRRARLTSTSTTRRATCGRFAIYRAKFGITFPLLLAGTTDEGQIAKTLPQLVGFGAFPTSIFIDRSGHVHAILAGFTGPSTGEKYQEVQQRMDELAREIVGPSH